MGICKWCDQEMTDKNATTCTGNTVVEFPDGLKLPSVPYKGKGFELSQFEDSYLKDNYAPEFKAIFKMFSSPQERMDYWIEKVGTKCHDCGVDVGGFHHPGCDTEKCPKCSGQLIGCGCLDERCICDACGWMGNENELIETDGYADKEKIHSVCPECGEKEITFK
jgi:hypothetical protein